MPKGKKFKLESRTIRLHPTLWQWADEDAEREGYERLAADLIGALILYNRAVGRRHWLTVQIMNNPEELERAIREIQEHSPLKGKSTFIDHRLEEIFGKQNKPTNEDPQNP